MTSERWAGFTDEDLARIKLNPANSDVYDDRSSEIDSTSHLLKKRGPMKLKSLATKTLQKERIFSECLEASVVECDVNKLPHKSKIETTESKNKITHSNNFVNKKTVCKHNGSIAEISDDSVKSKSISEDHLEVQCHKIEESNTSLPPLEVFELRQKRIEAENARRRALITKAIMDKKKQTQAEAIKLAKITEELNRLDSILSADVSILRNYIEKASLEFSEAEKRYLKAEKEFVEAKLILFEKMQRKEQLTEHLCAIIEQNENRKANKLVELMKQLEMEAVIEDCDENDTHPILPNLCILNDEAYHSCQTLKPSSPKIFSSQKLCTEKNSDEIKPELADSHLDDHISNKDIQQEACILSDDKETTSGNQVELNIKSSK